MSKILGTLIPIGGNEDKGEVNEEEGLDFIAEGILARVVQESGGVEAQILVIPTASSVPDKVGENYLQAFDKLGCTKVIILDIRESSQCEDEQNIELLKNADSVMFSGGDQSKIASIIGGTTFHKLLLHKYLNEAFVIAGTSAGAMAMTDEMVAGGSSTEAMLKGAVKLCKGLSLIPELIIDTHFIRRGRFGRMAEAIAIYPNLLGIGLAEDTGLVIKGGNEFCVIGSGMVIIFDGSLLSHNAHKELDEGTPMSISNLTTHILANGDKFTLNDRKVEVLPLNAAFV
jgi:cyanophycinase